MRGKGAEQRPAAVPGCRVANTVASQEGSRQPMRGHKLPRSASPPPFPSPSQPLFVQQLFAGDLQPG